MSVVYPDPNPGVAIDERECLTAVVAAWNATQLPAIPASMMNPPSGVFEDLIKSLRAYRARHGVGECWSWQDTMTGAIVIVNEEIGERRKPMNLDEAWTAVRREARDG